MGYFDDHTNQGIEGLPVSGLVDLEKFLGVIIGVPHAIQEREQDTADC
jgi:hypothetical protein